MFCFTDILFFLMNTNYILKDDWITARVRQERLLYAP